MGCGRRGRGTPELRQRDGAGDAGSRDCRRLPAGGRSQASWVTHFVFSYKGNESFIIKQEDRSARSSDLIGACVCG